MPDQITITTDAPDGCAWSTDGWCETHDGIRLRPMVLWYAQDSIDWTTTTRWTFSVLANHALREMRNKTAGQQDGAEPQPPSDTEE